MNQSKPSSTEYRGPSNGRAGTAGTGGPAEKVQDTAAKATEAVQEKSAEVRERIEQQADAGIDKAAESLGQASDQIREKAAAQGGVPGQVGTKVADGLDMTSEYLESHDATQIVDDLEKYVKEHPMAALAGAVVGGFVLARVLR